MQTKKQNQVPVGETEFPIPGEALSGAREALWERDLGVLLEDKGTLIIGKVFTSQS